MFKLHMPSDECDCPRLPVVSHGLSQQVPRFILSFFLPFLFEPGPKQLRVRLSTNGATVQSTMGAGWGTSRALVVSASNGI